MTREKKNHRRPMLHPYVRISDPLQRKGGGLLRQVEADVTSFASKFDFAVNPQKLVDDGVSAFRGLNATPDHALGEFLLQAKRGVILPGDCLLIENYDRMSRQNPWAAIGLVNDLRELGIHVGRLDRMKLLHCESTDYGDFFEAAVEFMRGNSESRVKSYRNGEKWMKRRSAARATGEILTRRLPAWIKVADKGMALIPEAAEAIKEIFRLSSTGYGAALIVKTLTARGVKPIGSSAHWSRSYVGLLLKDRRVLGEFQPHKVDGSPEGKPILGYFPPVVQEEEFYGARANASSRRKRTGRITERCELFSGLVKNAREGDTYFVATRTEATCHRRVLLNTNAAEGRAQAWSFPLGTFEEAVLSRLREVDPREVLQVESEGEDVFSMSEKYAGLEAKEAELEAELLNGQVAAIGRALRQVEDQKKELAEQIATAREKAAHPLSESWGECLSLLDTINQAANKLDARLRLRNLLGRVIDSIWVLVVPRGRARLCAVQIFFKEGARQRSYLVLHREALANASARKEPTWSCQTFGKAGLQESFDLRERKQANELLKVLEEATLPES